MKNTALVSALLGVSLSMLTTASAFADRDDRGHKHHKHHHHSQPVYIHQHYETRQYYEREDAYGRVIRARPIYQQVVVDVPQQSCRVETYAYQERSRGGDSFTGTVVGGLVGAALGHELGNGRGGATAVGGLIGASVGNNVSKGERATRYRDEQVCSTRYRTEYEQRLVGYDVSYSYMGRIYQTRTDRHPGDRIPVNVRADYRS